MMLAALIAPQKRSFQTFVDSDSRPLAAKFVQAVSDCLDIRARNRGNAVPASFAGMLVSGNQICGWNTTTPKFGLKHLHQSLDCLFAVPAFSPELCRLAVFDERQKPSVREHALYGVMHHVVRYDALLRARNGFPLASLTDDGEIVELTAALHEDQFYAPKSMQ